MRVVCEFETGQDLLDRLEELDADIVLLDLMLGDVDGFTLLDAIRRSRKELRVLVVSSCPQEKCVPRLMRLGAAGFLSKSCALETMLEAIREVRRGGRFLSPDPAPEPASTTNGQMTRGPGPPGAGPVHERLSNREFQVFRFLTTGACPTEIATRLRLSIKTVSTYRARIMQKMALHSTAELVLYAVEHDLLA